MSAPEERAAPRGRLLVLDGHSLAYRAFYGLPVENFSTSTGQVTNAVYGFTSMLLNVLRDEAPTHVVVAFDFGKRTFRTEAYPEYKAGRATTPSEFRGQVGLIQEVLAALRIPALSKEGYEADDIIATLTKRAEAAGLEVLVSTGDRDAFQLVSDQVTVLYPRKGVSDLARITPSEVEGRYGVPPERYPDLAALVGEQADNLPGVPGVGPKTAAKWLAAHGDLDSLLANADGLPGKAGQSLRDHLAQVQRNRELNALVTDLDLPLDVADLVRAAWNREEVHRVFDSLEFRVLRDRLLATLPEEGVQAPEAVRGGFDLEVLTPEGPQVGAWLAEQGRDGQCGLWVVGRWTAGSGDAHHLAVAAPSGSVAWFDLEALAPEAESALAAWLADGEAKKALHDAKGPLHALRERGLALEGLTDDTALSAYLCQPDQRSYDLADLSVRYLQRDLVAKEGEGEAVEACVRAAATRELAAALRQQVRERGGEGLLTELELPLVTTLGRMEAVGVAVDVGHLKSLEEEFGARVEAAARSAYEAVGHEVNLGSPKQLQRVLFEELQMPKTKKTKTGYTTDADALEALHARTKHPFLTHLLGHRDAVRLRQTVEGLLKNVADDARIHTTYQQMVAATGRLSSTDPNLQNIPIRTLEGRRIREAFVVGSGYERLVTADYSQIEMRIMAHLSKDEGLIEAFRSGEDLHRFVGSRVFGVAPEDVTPEMRAKVKAMSYGLAYGLSAFGLSRQLGISAEESRDLMEGYFDRFGGVREYLRGVVEEARGVGYTQTILGRRRYLPDLNSSNRQRREIAERMALNAPIQGSAADVIKVAMLNVERALLEEGRTSRLLLQIHDELVVEVAPGEAGTVEALLRREMGRAVELSVPLEVSVGSGRSWHEAGH